MRTALAAFVIALTLITPTRAQAQSSGPLAIPLQQTVWVTTSSGFEVQGDVISVTPAAIEVATRAGIKRVEMRDVQVIEKKDSNKNGFWIGFMVGAAPTIGMGGPQVLTHPVGLAFVLVGGLGYGGIGWLMDNAIEGREELYRKNAEGVTVTFAPIVGLGESKRVGVGGSISWR